MSEIQRVDDQFRRVCEGEAWCGPSLQQVLGGVSAKEASARPVPGGHSIWEIVLHVTTWEDVACRRLAGEHIGQLSPQEDWPTVTETGSQAWSETLEKIDRSHQRLRAALLKLSDEKLSASVRRGETVYVLMHGIVQHAAYHAGQIALLKKLVSGTGAGDG